MLAYPCNLDPYIHQFYTVKLGFTVYIIFAEIRKLSQLFSENCHCFNKNRSTLHRQINLMHINAMKKKSLIATIAQYHLLTIYGVNIVYASYYLHFSHSYLLDKIWN